MNYGVITVCLNSATTILRAMNSVFEQSVPPVEYVLVEGGSRDNTLQLIGESVKIANEKELGIRFKVINQSTNGGITLAWNMGLRELDADIVFILNSDDWYEQETADFVLSKFEKYPEVEIVTGSGRYVEKNATGKSRICNTRPFLFFPFAMTVIHPACFVRKDVYNRIGYFDQRYRVVADYEFVFRCYRSRVRFKNYRKVLVNVQTGGFAQKNREIARREMAEVSKEYSSLPILAKLSEIARCFLNK